MAREEPGSRAASGRHQVADALGRAYAVRRGCNHAAAPKPGRPDGAARARTDVDRPGTWEKNYVPYLKPDDAQQCAQTSTTVVREKKKNCMCLVPCACPRHTHRTSAHLQEAESNRGGTPPTRAVVLRTGLAASRRVSNSFPTRTPHGLGQASLSDDPSHVLRLHTALGVLRRAPDVAHPSLLAPLRHSAPTDNRRRCVSSRSTSDMDRRLV